MKERVGRQLNNGIRRSIFLFIIFSNLLLASQVFAQGVLTGQVTDDEFGEPLTRAVVSVRGTYLETTTDLQGFFSFKIVGGSYVLEINYPGYFRKYYNVSVYDGIVTPIGAIKLQANALNRNSLRINSGIKLDKQYPFSRTRFNQINIQEKPNNQEFFELIRKVPSAYYSDKGGGYGYSEIRFRGNDRSETAIFFNGIELNDPENGSVNSSFLSGLNDWSGSIQIQRGMTYNAYGDLSLGGQINVIGDPVKQKAGIEIKSQIGNDGMFNNSITMNTGVSKKGLAVSLQISRNKGNGYADNTDYSNTGFLANIYKSFNYKHSLLFTVFANAQEHNLRYFNDSIGTYETYGNLYNSNWGYLDLQKYSWNTNFGRSPLVSLNHNWQTGIKTNVYTTIYAVFDRQGETSPLGTLNGNPVDSIPRDENGLYPFSEIVRWNDGETVSGFGDPRAADENGKYINSEISGISTMSTVKIGNSYGIRSVFNYSFNKKINIRLGISARIYQARHFAAITDTLGADGFISYTNSILYPDGFEINSFLKTDPLAKFNSVDKAVFFYESSLQAINSFAHFEYKYQRFQWFLQTVGSAQQIQRTGHYSYFNESGESKSQWVINEGGKLLTGLGLQLGKHHLVRGKIGASIIPPKFTTVFPSATEWENKDAKDIIKLESDIGYSFYSRKLELEINGYISKATNLTSIQNINLLDPENFAIISNQQVLKEGAELQFNYLIWRNFRLNASASYGNWKYLNNAKANVYNTLLQKLEEKELPTKNLRVGGSAQTTLYLEGQLKVMRNTYLSVNYYLVDQLYGNFGIHDFDLVNDTTEFEPLKLPKYDLIGVNGSYHLKMNQNHALDIIFGIQNILNKEFITESSTSLSSSEQYGSNRVYFGPGKTWNIKIIYQFR